jgi:magnesium transporter
MRQYMLVSALMRSSILKNTLLKLLRKGYSESLVSLMDRIHPADLAMSFSEMETSETCLMFDQISNDRHAAHIIAELKNKNIRNKIIMGLNSKRVNQIFSHIKPNITVKILDSLPPKEAQIIIKLMNKNEVDELAKLQKHKKATAGKLMNTSFLKLRADTSFDEALKQIKKDPDFQKQDYVYLIDKNNTLVGRLQIKDILGSTSKIQALSEVSESNPLYIRPATKKNDIIQLFKKYRPKEIVVVNEKKQVLGVINYKDFIRIIIEHTPKMLLKNAGSNYIQDMPNNNVWCFFKARIAYLILCFISGLFIYASLNFITQPQSQTIKFVFLLPLIILISMAVSSQSFSTLSIFISEYDYKKRLKAKFFLKELKIALINGTILTSLFMIYNSILQNLESEVSNISSIFNTFVYSNLTISASIAIFLTVLISATFGSLLPILISKTGKQAVEISLPVISLLSCITNSILYLWLSTFLMTKGII